MSVESDTAKIGMSFTTRTRKWDADVTTEDRWIRQMSDLTSVFIPAKEILSNSWNLDAAVKMGNVEFDDTYLDIIAAAKVDISRGVDSAEKKKIFEDFTENQHRKGNNSGRQILFETRDTGEA